MKQALLVSVAAVALAAGSTLALAQGGGSSGQGPGGAGGTMQANPPAGGGGSMSKDADSPGMKKKGAQERTQERTGPQQRQTQGKDQEPGMKRQQTQQDRQQPGTQQRQQTQQDRQQPGTQQRQTETPSGGGAKQGTAQGSGQRPMASSNVSLTTEQKTTIRSKVLTSSAPRVTNVNFQINVGTVVPRTVRVAPVPVTLVEIEPTWRGYMYFVHGDEIIIVEPRTLKIVAVLAV